MRNDNFLRIPIRSFQFRRFMFILGKLLPSGNGLPIFMTMNNLRNSITSTMTFNFPFRRTKTIINMNVRKRITRMNISNPYRRMKHMTIHMILTRIRTTRRSPMNHSKRLFQRRPMTYVNRNIRNIGLFLITLNVSRPIIKHTFMRHRIKIEAFLMRTLHVNLRTNIIMQRPRNIVHLPIKLRI